MKLSFHLFITILFLVLKTAAAEPKFFVNLKDWPDDVVAKIQRITPEIIRKDLSERQLNEILKKLDEAFNFNSLRLVKIDVNSDELVLVGEISPETKFKFEGISEVTEAEALNTMGLTLNSSLDEENLKLAAEKLVTFYRELGYRFAEVKYRIESDGTLSKRVVFSINKKAQTVLRSIDIEGLEDKVLTKQIEDGLRRKFWRAELTQDTLNKISSDLRIYLSSGGYYLAQVPSPQIQFAANELNAKVRYRLPTSQRYRVEVTNSKQYSHEFLEEEILKLNTYFSKDGNLGSELAEELKKFYLSEGYPNVSILYYESKIEGRIHLFLSVEEGPYTHITKFKVVGQFSKPEKFYHEKFLELGTPKLQEGLYIKEDIDAAAKNLLIYLQNQGYVNAKISRVISTIDRDNPNEGSVIIQLEEGPQVKLAKLEIIGASEKNKNDALSALKLKVGQSLSLAQLEESVLNLKLYYQNLGYIEYRLVNETQDLIKYTENNSQASLKFVVQEGPQVVVQSIITEGNTRTLDKLIMLELDFDAGDILTPSKIEESISRLQRTGYFNSVEIATLEKDTSVSQRTVVVKVVERDPGLFLFGVGLTTENKGTLHGYGGIAYRNFWGRGVGLSLRTEANYNFAEIKFLENKHTLGLVWPYIFDTRARFRTSATRSTTISDSRINKISEANTAVFSIEEDFSSHITGLFSYVVSTFFDHGIEPTDEIKYNYNSESLVIGSVGPAIEFDYRDNLFNPSKGSFTRFAFEYAADGLGNNNVDDFYRATAQTTLYVPVNKSGMTFIQAVRAGYIKVTDDRAEGVPFDKRGFSLGGRTTIRGFESSEFFPTTQEIGASYRLLSASKYQLVKSELRFPISVKYDLGAAVFYDGGQVTIDGLDLTNKWRDAVGLGFHYNSPVGPINLEYAQKINKKQGESDGAFHLSIGVF